MKISFTMRPHPDQPKNSTRWNYESPDEGTVLSTKFNPSFYIPRPVAQNAKRIRVTIEEIE